jgi:hypothetical protein
LTALLQKEFDKLHKQGGKPPKLTIRNTLFITLKYLREYRTMESIGADYRVCKGTVSLLMAKWVENTLKKALAFKLSGKEILKEEASPIHYLVVNVTERPIQGPKKQKERYSGKKKRHTIKTQVIINRKTHEIIEVL